MFDGNKTTDYQTLEEGYCPDCGTPIAHYFYSSSKPWCRHCDVYFDFCSNGWVVRNTDAQRLYDERWKQEVGDLEVGV